MRRSPALAFPDERFFTTATKTLLTKFTSSSEGVGKDASTKYLNRPIDVVGEELCDDITSYLAPTLKQHQGCTILDFFPGPALFSSKLHELLQPQSHILIEPEDFYVKPFLQPLLDRPGSTYRHLTLAGVGSRRQWYRFRKIYDSTFQPLLDASHSTSKQGSDKFNPNILVIGNASRLCKTGGRSQGDIPFGIGILRQLGSDALAHGLFNQHGPVRMLWWVPEKHKSTVIPPHYVYGRSNTSTQIEMAFDVTEVAGVQSSDALRHSLRDNYTERERNKVFRTMNNTAVAERMHEAGLVVPDDRLILDVFRSGTRSSVTYMSPLDNTAQSVEVLSEQITKAQERLTSLTSWITRRKMPAKKYPHRPAYEAALASIEYPQCIKGKEHYEHTRATYINNGKFGVLSDMALIMANIEAGFIQLMEEKKIPETQRKELLDRTNELFKSFWSIFKAGQNGKNVNELIRDFVEDQIAFYSSSPVSTLERRAYEPLKAQTSDFYPKHNLSLIDFMPRDIDLSVPDLAGRSECVTFMRDLLKHLFASRNKPIPAVLEKAIGVNAGRDLVQMVPEITDIRKGGRLDPNQVKVRALTREMIEGLVKAFFEWPFKPENWQLSLAQTKAEDMEVRYGSKDEIEEDAVAIAER